MFQMDLILKNHIIFVFNLNHMLGLEKKWMLINQWPLVWMLNETFV